jgi:hypothetical protein
MATKVYSLQGAECKAAVIVGSEGNGVLIPGVRFEDDDLPDHLNRKYLLPIRMREGIITEVPWKSIKRKLFGSSIRNFKEELSQLIENGDPVESIELPLTEVRTLKIGPKLPLKREQFTSLFFTDPDHLSVAVFNYGGERQKRREFETCRGAVDLAQILKSNGLGLEVSVVQFDFGE